MNGWPTAPPQQVNERPTILHLKGKRPRSPPPAQKRALLTISAGFAADIRSRLGARGYRPRPSAVFLSAGTWGGGSTPKQRGPPFSLPLGIVGGMPPWSCGRVAPRWANPPLAH